MAAIAPGGVRVVNGRVVETRGISAEEIERIAAEEQGELERREREDRDGRPMPDVRGRTVILVDDGLATGSSMRVAAIAVRKIDPARIVVAVPWALAPRAKNLRPRST